jgi:hypothetical protein
MELKASPLLLPLSVHSENFDPNDPGTLKRVKDIVAAPPPISMRDLLHHLGIHTIRDDTQGGHGSRDGSQAQSDDTPQGHEDVHEGEMQE